MSIITYYYCRRRHHQLLQLQLLVLYFVITNVVIVSITAFNFNLNDSQNNSNNNNNNQRGNNNSNNNSNINSNSNSNSNSNLNSNINSMKFAWKSRGKNQHDLIQQLRKSGIIRTDIVQQIMEQVDRKNYCYYPTILDSDEDIDVDEDSSSTISELLCYSDRALSLIKGQTISAPHMHAYVLEEVFPSLLEQYSNIVNRRSTSSTGENDDDDNDNDNNNKNKNEIIKILDVGCGSGYLTACFGRFIELLSTTTDTTTTDSKDDSTSMMAADTNSNNNSSPTIIGKVFGIDIHQDLVDMTRHNINRQDSDLLLAEGSSTSTSTSSIINLSWGNGWKGLQEEAPFDCIHVGAAAESFPSELMNQLKVNGLMVIPVGSSQESSSKPQLLYKIHRIANNNSVVVRNSRNDNSSSYDDKIIYYDEDDFEITTLLGVRYVPLIHDDNDDEDK